MKKYVAMFVLGAAGALALAVGVHRAWAGARETPSFTIGAWNVDPDLTQASGLLSSIRSSGGSSDYLGCKLIGWGQSTVLTAECYARKGNTTAFCVSSDPQFARMVGGIRGDSWVQFIYDGSGVCQVIQVKVDSRHQPKAP